MSCVTIPHLPAQAVAEHTWNTAVPAFVSAYANQDNDSSGRPAALSEQGLTPGGGRHRIRAVPPGTTTLAVRNIPARYNQEKLLLDWEPDGSFDMLYLPFDIRQNRTTGCAYINFTSHEAALEFQRAKQGTHLSKHGRGKHLDIAAASRQGLMANLQQFLTGKSVPCDGQLAAFFAGAKAISVPEVLIRLGLPTFGSRFAQSSTTMDVAPPACMTTPKFGGGLRTIIEISAMILPMNFPAVTEQVRNAEKEAEQSATRQALMQMSISSVVTCRGSHSTTDVGSSVEGSQTGSSDCEACPTPQRPIRGYTDAANCQFSDCDHQPMQRHPGECRFGLLCQRQPATCIDAEMQEEQFETPLPSDLPMPVLSHNAPLPLHARRWVRRTYAPEAPSVPLAPISRYRE